MDKTIPMSCKIPPDREIAVDLSVIMEYLSVTPEMFASIWLISEESLKNAMRQKNSEIDIHLLSMLYMMANESFIKYSVGNSFSEEQLNTITCFRRLRDACKNEYKRRCLQNNDI